MARVKLQKVDVATTEGEEVNKEGKKAPCVHCWKMVAYFVR